MHSVMPVRDDGTPLSPAMTWADNRAIAEASALRRRTDHAAIYQRTGCPLQWQYHAAKLTWLRTHAAEAFANANHFAAIKDWIIHRLTGRWVTDVCIASSTGLLDLHRRTWDAESLELAGIEASRLPALLEPDDEAGRVHASAAAETGLPLELPVYPGGSDGGMAIIGASADEPGRVVMTVGTSGAVRITTELPRLDPKERTWCYALTCRRFFAGGAINNGGLAVEWLRATCYGDLSAKAGFARLFADAATVEPGAEGLLFLPYLTGERSPHWRADLRAGFVGLTARHTRAHLARAVLEAVAFCLADVWQALAINPAEIHSVQLTGGIVRSPLWCQIVADVLGVPLHLSDAADASAVGAALIAGRGCGVVTPHSQAPPAAVADLTPVADRVRQYQSVHSAFQAALHDRKQ